MSSKLGKEQLVHNGRSVCVSGVEGTLFYCSNACYGQFVETKVMGRGRTLVFETETASCPSGFTAAEKNGFLDYRE